MKIQHVVVFAQPSAGAELSARGMATVILYCTNSFTCLFPYVYLILLSFHLHFKIAGIFVQFYVTAPYNPMLYGAI